RRLRGEIDLPIPQLRASDPDGATVGQPYLLLSDLPGEPLAQALGRIPDDALYQLGRRLGAIAGRIHRLACDSYGALGGSGHTAANEHDYVLARVERATGHCAELGLLDRRSGAALLGWFAREFVPTGRQPALVHGGLGPHTLLVRQGDTSGTRGAWRVSGVLGWETALGWCPAWEHATWLDTIDEPRYFSLRVGYGNGYDEQNSRTYEQVREHVLAPYRLLLLLDRMQAAHAAGDIAGCERRRSVLRGLMEFLDLDTR
ncbi:MAG TPA: aminoglycoside phosphotransferase family protein, partial [Kouleothrix sp.]|nr:aminoglycoside phosphotransferase family protein [Kouleothrix sp.]